MENPRHIIINCLKVLQNRARRQTIFETLTQAIFFAMCFLAVLFVGIRLFLFPFSLSLVTLYMIIGAIVFGICFGFRYRKTLSDIAGFVDERQQLKERVSTSLELIHESRQDEIAQLQILDSADGIANTDAAKIIPYTLPRLLKWIPVPLLIIGFSFVAPRQYELPQPPTAAEHEAIDKTIQDLSDSLEYIQNPIVQDEIRKTVKQLKNVKDVVSAQEHLRTLNSQVQQQKSDFPDESAIAQATQVTQHFKGMDTTTLADELEHLAEQAELTPELRDELVKLFTKLVENVPQGELSRALNQVQGKAVSPETLQEIVDALHQLDQLNQLETQLTESRKDIALAGIDIDQPTGRFAHSDGAPGQESGNQETQGTQAAGPSNFSPSDSEAIPSTDENTTEKPLTGDEAPPLEVAGDELKLNSETASDTQSITRVFSGNAGHVGTAPDYLPFSEAVLAAQREYAQAIENDRIPIQYRSQIKAYLEAVTKIDEQ